jgi:hypothetical protein
LIISKLEAIFVTSNVDDNKILGKSILENIAEDISMTTKQKQDYKAILNTLVYGSVVSIPEDEKNKVIGNEPPEDD